MNWCTGVLSCVHSHPCTCVHSFLHSSLRNQSITPKLHAFVSTAWQVTDPSSFARFKPCFFLKKKIKKKNQQGSRKKKWFGQASWLLERIGRELAFACNGGHLRVERKLHGLMEHLSFCLSLFDFIAGWWKTIVPIDSQIHSFSFHRRYPACDVSCIVWIFKQQYTLPGSSSCTNGKSRQTSRYFWSVSVLCRIVCVCVCWLHACM
jgi:hypothetical protein